MKKGRHRRFEEARKLKQSGPDFLFAGDVETRAEPEPEEDDYAAIARKYGAFDDDDGDDESTGDAAD